MCVASAKTRTLGDDASEDGSAEGSSPAPQSLTLHNPLFAGWKRLYLVPSRPRFLQEARRARKRRHRVPRRPMHAAKGLYVDQRHHLVAAIEFSVVRIDTVRSVVSSKSAHAKIRVDTGVKLHNPLVRHTTPRGSASVHRKATRQGTLFDEVFIWRSRPVCYPVCGIRCTCSCVSIHIGGVVQGGRRAPYPRSRFRRKVTDDGKTTEGNPPCRLGGAHRPRLAGTYARGGTARVPAAALRRVAVTAEDGLSRLGAPCSSYALAMLTLC